MWVVFAVFVRAHSDRFCAKGKPVKERDRLAKQKHQQQQQQCLQAKAKQRREQSGDASRAKLGSEAERESERDERARQQQGALSIHTFALWRLIVVDVAFVNCIRRPLTVLFWAQLLLPAFVGLYITCSFSFGVANGAGALFALVCACVCVCKHVFGAALWKCEMPMKCNKAWRSFLTR